MRILLGLSGGVDSTYAALKLKKQGHEVEGAVVLMHDYTDREGASRSALEIGIPLHEIDAREAFSRVVCGYFIDEYLSGRTPNPCVICNREVKFKSLYDYAKNNGFDAIATGHYARVNSISEDGEVRYFISRALDGRKDQSYMLSRLSSELLSSLVLPMGDEIKSDITDTARNLGFSSANKRESQEICFIPDGKYTEFIESRAGASPAGDFINENGETLGKHKGIIHYTVGQRKGLDIALGHRVFVTGINPVDNTVMLEAAPRLSSTVKVKNIIFSKISVPDSEKSYKLSVKLRYLAPPVECDVTVFRGGEATVRLNTPQGSVTPGQSAVFYDGDDCAFSGIIECAD